MISPNKVPALRKAIADLKAEGVCPSAVEHQRVKYLNSLIEGDHCRLKRILGPKGAFKKTGPRPTGRNLLNASAAATNAA